ncbi:hypothetical protein WR25_22111 [Diploscapter pachys]|uniref:4Fe-4S ferredoxin-type domain-containing protein n=1 Tax=Diploscapter pachys TaxID=2018661 RepID=A0A2A2LC20_9BILA|nr:hypothetical protein WR25_22111 [Diploscapter pachys]
MKFLTLVVLFCIAFLAVVSLAQETEPTEVGHGETAEPTEVGHRETAEPTEVGHGETAEPTEVGNGETAEPTEIGNGVTDRSDVFTTVIRSRRNQCLPPGCVADGCCSGDCPWWCKQCGVKFTC